MPTLSAVSFTYAFYHNKQKLRMESFVTSLKDWCKEVFSDDEKYFTFVHAHMQIAFSKFVQYI